jgi:hypothetical protein
MTIMTSKRRLSFSPQGRVDFYGRPATLMFTQGFAITSELLVARSIRWGTVTRSGHRGRRDNGSGCTRFERIALIRSSRRSGCHRGRLSWYLLIAILTTLSSQHPMEECPRVGRRRVHQDGTESGQNQCATAHSIATMTPHLFPFESNSKLAPTIRSGWLCRRSLHSQCTRHSRR